MPASAFYNPNTGRWLNRDPIEESGGINLLALCLNRIPNKHDVLGLFDTDIEYRLNWPANSPIWPSPGTGALTEVIKKEFVSPRSIEGNCDVYKTKVTARYRITYKAGVDPSESRTFGGTPLGEHEETHIAYHNYPLMGFESAFANYKFCCGGKCRTEFKTWIEAAFQTAVAQGNADSIGYDLSGEYAPTDPLLPTIRETHAAALKELEKRRATETDSKKKFDTCIASSMPK